MLLGTGGAMEWKIVPEKQIDSTYDITTGRKIDSRHQRPFANSCVILYYGYDITNVLSITKQLGFRPLLATSLFYFGADELADIQLKTCSRIFLNANVPPMKHRQRPYCWYISVMTSSDRNIFRFTGPLWVEAIGRRWFLRTKASDKELWCFLWSAFEQTVEQTIETLAIWNAIALIMATVMGFYRMLCVIRPVPFVVISQQLHSGWIISCLPV